MTYKKLLQISDVHVNDYSDQTHQDFRQICRKIASKYRPQEHVVLITGDITEDGSKKEYERAAESIRILTNRGFGVHMVPGNHDYGCWGNFYELSAHRRYQKFHKENCPFKSDALPVFLDYGAWRLILLDSVAHEAAAELFARGRIGKPQLHDLKVMLSADSRPSVIAMHHHPMLRPWRGELEFPKEVLEIVDSKEFMEIVRTSRQQAPVMVCCGHKHVEDLSFIREKGLRGVAAGKCTENFKVIEIDPVKQEARSVHLGIKSVGTKVEQIAKSAENLSRAPRRPSPIPRRRLSRKPGKP
jgi:3',5'-cyclic AMP phosphodiesterase CpdA